MYEVLKAELQNIVELVETLPDRYKDRCFDLLLTALISQQEAGEEERPEQEGRRDVGDGDRRTKQAPLPAKVRAFIQRNAISEDELRKLFLIEGDEFHFIQEPAVSQNAAGQIQWSLLLALKNALLGGDLEVDAESVRSVCIEKGLYDKGNFASTFKKAKNAAYFQAPPEPQGSAVKLSGAGEKRLAELVKSLVA